MYACIGPALIITAVILAVLDLASVYGIGTVAYSSCVLSVDLCLLNLNLSCFTSLGFVWSVVHSGYYSGD